MLAHIKSSENHSLNWLTYFRVNRANLLVLPWADNYRISNAERAAITTSIQQFQLGEGANGRGFLRRARVYADHHQDPFYVQALELFVAEEHRHSNDLGRFMDLQQIARLNKHWVDGAFRHIRKLAGLELCIRVLVSAEIIAVPYYTALRAATKSPLLRKLCDQILSDEERHLEFQGSTLRKLEQKRWPITVRLSRLLHAFLLAGTVLVVWREHAQVLRRGSYSLPIFAGECFDLLYRTILLREVNVLQRGTVMPVTPS